MVRRAAWLLLHVLLFGDGRIYGSVHTLGVLRACSSAEKQRVAIPFRVPLGKSRASLLPWDRTETERGTTSSPLLFWDFPFPPLFATVYLLGLCAVGMFWGQERCCQGWG